MRHRFSFSRLSVRRLQELSPAVVQRIHIFTCGYLGDNYRLARFSMRQSSAATFTFTNKS